MLEGVKHIVRSLLIALEWPVTRNIRYDILTGQVLRRALHAQSSCVDVGAHKGEMLQLIRQNAPQGQHFAFEPIPQLYDRLKRSEMEHVEVFPYALSNFEGATAFHLVKSDPAYSGIKRRTYAKADAEIELIEVQVRCMDEVLKSRTAKIDLIKIDVEGGELDVMKGAHQILATDQPLLVFECGKGASEFYNNTPEMVFDFLSDASYEIYRLSSFLQGEMPYERTQFISTFQTGDEYYFIAQVKG
jgi:FkbM family methyltransferase